MADTPFVSILMPTYNSGRLLEASVRSILRQTLKEFELIIVDDHSTDNSVEAIRRLHDQRIVIVRNPENRGVSAARNIAARLASAPLLACMDADDISLPSRLEHETRIFGQTTDLALLGSCAYLIDGDGRRFDTMDIETSETAIRRNVLRKNPMIHSSVMIRASIFNNAGGYPEDTNLGEDYGLWTRIIPQHRTINLPDRLIEYRIHSNQTSLMRAPAMRRAAGNIQRQAWAQLISNDLSSDILPPSRTQCYSKLAGCDGSLGNDYLYWASLYRRKGDTRTAFKAILKGLCVAPLCPRLYAAALPQRLVASVRHAAINIIRRIDNSAD